MAEKSKVIDEKTVFTKVDGGQADQTLFITNDDGTVVMMMIKVQKMTGDHVDAVDVTNQISWPSMKDFKKFYKTAGEAIDKQENQEP